MDEFLYIDSLQGTGCTVYAQILWPWQDYLKYRLLFLLQWTITFFPRP